MVMERGLLMRNPLQMLMLRLNHGTDGDMDGHTMVATTATGRGQLTRNLHPMLMPRPSHGTDGDMDGHTMVVTGMERGLPTQNPLPLLLPRLNHGITAAMDTDGPTMVTPYYGKRSADAEPAPNADAK